ncbi:protein serine/threonine phosphatase 2C [Cubamyces sp. BRFM 1775]|nr:protein serine/threonine phosphatase 2C [Cubamyces sp. BRFM 1775]
MDDSDRQHEARQRMAGGYIGWQSTILDIHSATFQPRGIKESQDRVKIDLWEICGNHWLFLAVFDGHLGNATVEYTSRELPRTIRRKLRAFVHSVGGRLDRTNVAENEGEITAMLKREIEQFDKGIGDALQRVCPRPWELTEEQARRLIEEEPDIVRCAFAGTTLAFALVNHEERFMWAAGLGDSSAGISIIDGDGKVQAQRLCDMHTFKDPKEYFRATMEHPYAEQPLFDWENRVLGWLSVARAIGDFSLKLPSSYLSHLFRFLPELDGYAFSEYIPRIVTPPYVSSEPSVRFTDLHPMWRPENKIFLFTDGVDNLVDGWLVFKPKQHSGADPVQTVADLLCDDINPRVEDVLGHKVVPRWSGEEGNRATDVLGNLLGGEDVERLEMVTDLDRLNCKEGWPFHIDDVSLIVWPMTDL